MLVSDETLNAYLDGELGAAEAEALDTAIRQSPVLAERVRQARALARTLDAAYAPVLDAPVPQRLLDAVANYPLGNAGSVPGVSSGATIVNLAAARSERSMAGRPVQRWPWASLVAVAASLAAGVMIGTLHRPAALVTGLAVADPVADILESTPSGMSMTTASGDAVKPRTSFLAANGTYCREFDLAAGSSAASGIACRDQAGWRVALLTTTDGDARPGMGGDGYTMATGGGAPAVEAVLRTLGAGDPLDQAQEAKAMASGWHR